MSEPRAALSACYSDWKLVKTRSVIQLIFEIPLEAHNGAFEVLGGMPQPGKEVWCGIARLDLKEVMPPEQHIPVDKPPASETPPAPTRARKPVAADKRLAQQAGRCCADPVFHAYLFEHDMAPEKSEACAATAVRLICGVQSRAEIVPGTPAGDEWERLYGRFIAWKLAA